MIYELRLARRAANYVARLDRPTTDRILRRLEEITTDPFGPNSKPLTNAAGKRSSRVGDYRIIYEVDRVIHIVDVVAIAPRGQAYRDI